MKSPRYPARFLKSPERKSSITVRRASGNFSCNASVRLEPMKPAPPVTRRLGADCGTLDGIVVAPVLPCNFLSFRPKWRNGASGTSDMDGWAARESGDERVQSL